MRPPNVRACVEVSHRLTLEGHYGGVLIFLSSSVRARLNETKPTRRELRVAFIARLRRAVVWLNRTHRRALLALGSNQRKRAREVIENGGHRTSW